MGDIDQVHPGDPMRASFMNRITQSLNSLSQSSGSNVLVNHLGSMYLEAKSRKLSPETAIYCLPGSRAADASPHNWDPAARMIPPFTVVQLADRHINDMGEAVSGAMEPEPPLANPPYDYGFSNLGLALEPITSLGGYVLHSGVGLVVYSRDSISDSHPVQLDADHTANTLLPGDRLGGWGTAGEGPGYDGRACWDPSGPFLVLGVLGENVFGSPEESESSLWSGLSRLVIEMAGFPIPGSGVWGDTGVAVVLCGSLRRGSSVYVSDSNGVHGPAYTLIFGENWEWGIPCPGVLTLG